MGGGEGELGGTEGYETWYTNTVLSSESLNSCFQKLGRYTRGEWLYPMFCFLDIFFLPEVSTAGCHLNQDIKLGRYLIWLNHSYYTYLQCQERCSHFLYSTSVRYVPRYSASTLSRIAKPLNNTKKPRYIWKPVLSQTQQL